MSAQTQARRPQGVPTGGQFATTAHSEAPVTLGAQPDKTWRTNEAITGLNTTQRRLVAASLEIDGRADRASTAGVSGHISEFRYRKGVPDSPKAKEQEALREALEQAVRAEGVEGTVAALREEA